MTILQNIQAAIVVVVGTDVHLIAGVGEVWHRKFPGMPQPAIGHCRTGLVQLSGSIVNLSIPYGLVDIDITSLSN